MDHAVGLDPTAVNVDQIRKLEDQIVVKGRIVMLGMRNANPAAIDDVRSIVEQHGGVIELSGIRNVGRIVRMMPPDAEAAAALGEWLERADSLLDASALDLSQADGEPSIRRRLIRGPPP